ncbi:BadF/BadG/BcrA/BcrD ATPase family protein [Curtobacterium sp. PhB136]|uniref:N-acetylglucosamine kinase n=1 Tax=Curtobacterium sp. PhB136 TaxID=2485181 RepID=UPI0010D8046B|nr:BadF/BadG/BcrA/BcrD ATPase family protein [Curtobacterium sp. PhB136]TCK63494.1 N-acetylglucosamine kinase-like BadF-type ATPase [Curtobacterium sp. PhB136]
MGGLSRGGGAGVTPASRPTRDTTDASGPSDVGRAPDGGTTDAGRAPDVVLAVDGGGSKTDVVAIALDGTLVGHARGPGSNPQTRGWELAGPILDDVRGRVVHALDGARVLTTHVYLAGLDLPDEITAATAALQHWAQDGGAPDVLDNDLFALLRAGTLSPDAAAVVCGTGINALAVRADGATSRFPAIGDVSGDWGGGAYLGNRALWHAARAEDGRGPATALTAAVPAALGLGTVREVTEAVHFGRLDQSVFNRLCPVLFEVAATGDPVAAGVVARQAEEIVLLASVALGRLGLGAAGSSVPVVLGGGVLAARHPLLVDAVVGGLAARVPGAVPTWVTAPPVLGAGLAALESVGAEPAALERYRAAVLSRSFASTTARIA